MRVLGWLTLLPVCLVASAACQTLSGVDDLEVVLDRDAAAGTAGTTGNADDGSTGSGGAQGTAGASGAAGTGGEGGSAGNAGSSGSAGTEGSAGTGGSAGTLGSAGLAGSAGMVGTGGAGGTGGSAGSGGTGGAPECDAPTDCPAENDPCARRSCTSGKCGLSPEPQGTVVPEQTSGDCKKNVCDGSGRVVSVNDDTDPRDDGKACTRNVCTNGVPANPPEPINTPCGLNTKCDGAGRCVGCTSNGDCPADTPCTDWSCVTTSGACASTPRSTSTACGPAPACTAGVAYPQDFCDGAGACRDSGSQSCGPRVCGTGACLTACTTDTQCVAGYYCAMGGSCQPKKGIATGCSVNSECTSGFCVDGVCCETACTGLCNTCNGTDSGGLPPGYCFPIASGRDPAGECAGGRVCNGSSGCTGVQQCDCNTLRYSPSEICCTDCSNSECLSQVNQCSTAHGTPCSMIGNVGSYRAGQGIGDQSGSCSPMVGQVGQRCAVFTCQCVQ